MVFLAPSIAACRSDIHAPIEQKDEEEKITRRRRRIKRNEEKKPNDDDDEEEESKILRTIVKSSICEASCLRHKKKALDTHTI